MTGPSSDPSAFHEPHMGGSPGSAAACTRCGYPREGTPEGRPCAECGAPQHPGGAGVELERVDASVFDEPTFSPELAGEAPAGADAFASWLTRRRAAMTPGRSWAIVLGLAVAAGPWAVLGAFCAALSGDGLGGVLALVVFGPLLEEVMKVSAATYAVERRPYWFVSRAGIIACGALGGLAFSVIENALYLLVYVPNPTADLILWRWTVCVALHAGCSAIAAMGLARVWRATVDAGRPADLNLAMPYLVAAIAVHGAYNAFAVVLHLTRYGF